MKYIKKYRNYIFLFLFFFLVLSVFSFYNHSYDSFWNYSFSYAIARGEVPYVDFNTVSTPFCAFFISFFLIFSHHYLWYIFGWSLVLTFTFYLLFQVIQHRSFIVLFALLFPFLHTIIPTSFEFIFMIFTGFKRVSITYCSLCGVIFLENIYVILHTRINLIPISIP